MNTSEMPQINFRLEPDDFAKLKLIAAQEGTTLTTLLRDSVARIIEDREQNGKAEWLRSGIG